MAGRNDGRRPPPETAEDSGFLSRWSKRKAEARTVEQAAVSPEMADEALDNEGLPAKDEQTEPPAFDVASLPDIDSLGPKSDFSVFMQAGVPSELKTKALRKLWRVKSELANLDGLIDYGEDLTGSFKVVDHLKTAYEVGRGFLRDDADDPEKGDQPVEKDQLPAESAHNEKLAQGTLEEDVSKTGAKSEPSKERVAKDKLKKPDGEDV